MSQRLPPLNAIRVFDIAARQLNFARAADELGVTQSAVSKQISILEESIGTRLFERSAAGVSLTLEGRELKHSIAPAFDMLTQSFQRYARSLPSSNRIRLATVASFAGQFLIPRLHSFEQCCPDIRLDITTSDRVLDLSREAIDLSIRYGVGDWENVISEPLVDGALVPICSPDTFAQHNEDATAILNSARRIQVFLKNEWNELKDAAGKPASVAGDTLMFEHFLVALQAVVLNRGIALLPRLIVTDQLRSGALIQFSDTVPWVQTFYLCHLPGTQLRVKHEDFISWLKAAVASEVA